MTGNSCFLAAICTAAPAGGRGRHGVEEGAHESPISCKFRTEENSTWWHMARKDVKDVFRMVSPQKSTNTLINRFPKPSSKKFACSTFSLLCSCLWTRFKVALKVVVQRERGEWARRAGGRRGKRDHSCKLDSNKAPLMSPLGNWRRREQKREEKGASAARNAHLHRGWMLTFRVDKSV